jgi:Zn-dependent protease/CBS domain-containing protein
MAGDRAREREAARPGELPLGDIAGIPVFLASSWFIYAGLITLVFAPAVQSRAPQLGSGRFVVSAMFAVFLCVSVLIHELGHALTAKGFGIGVRRITLSLLGGMTEMNAEEERPGQQAIVSGTGPVLSLAIGFGGMWLAHVLQPGSVPEILAVGVGISNLLVGAFNLLPGLPLDGGQLLRALLWKVTGSWHRGTVAAAWAGRGLAVLVALSPVLFASSRGSSIDTFNLVWALFIAFFVWTGASAALKSAHVRRRIPALTARGLARRAVAVPAAMPVAEAVRRIAEAGARAAVVVDVDDHPVAIVSEAAVSATPPERRPWITSGEVSRRLDPALILTWDLSGEALLAAMSANPSSEYLVVDSAGKPYGVLATSDVERAFAGV